MGIENIILRTVSHSPLVTKGSTLTWEEEDNNFGYIYDSLYALENPDVTLFEAYDSGTSYESGDYVSYSGNIWRFINAIPATGVTPGTDPLTWELASIGEFAHQQNHDTYLDFGGPNEISAAAIVAFINGGLASDYFAQGGNSFGANATLGTNDAFALLFETNNVTRGGMTRSGQWMIGTTTPQASTELTIKGTGTGSGTNTFVGLNSADALIFKLRDDGGFVFYENLYDSSSVKIADVANRIFYTTGNVGAIAINEFALYPNNSFSSLEWDLRICKDSSNDETLDWENREFTKNWKFNNDLEVVGDSVISDNTKAYYIGGSTTNGSWRRRIDGTDLIDERRESGVWVEKSRITP